MPVKIILMLGLSLMALAYVLDRRRYGGGEESERGLTGRMLRIAVPLALSAYARSALTTLRHMLVPRGLRAAGWSADGALSGYGVIQGMVLPVLFFPACIMGALAELIVPELTASQVRGDGRAITATTGELLRASVWFSADAWKAAPPLKSGKPPDQYDRAARRISSSS